jgi:hypothetical protein
LSGVWLRRQSTDGVTRAENTRFQLPPGTNIVGAHSVEELCKKLKTPRKVILLVKAGQAVDDFIAQLEPHMEKGDIIIDGGNSHYPDSIRRTEELYKKGLYFVGSGVSGGEEGARYGPSLMPGGAPEAWPAIKEIFRGLPGNLMSSRVSSADRRCFYTFAKQKRPPLRPTESHAATGSERVVPVTTSRWFTTVSSTETCSSSPRLTASSRPPLVSTRTRLPTFSRRYVARGMSRHVVW